MNTNNIKFAHSSESNTTAPWDIPKRPNYDDMIFKEKYVDCQVKFQAGTTTWLRILPKLESSQHGWMMHVPLISYKGGRFVDPSFFRDNAKSVFNDANSWFKINAPGKLYSDSNKKGFKLFPTEYGVFWSLVQDESGPPSALKLFVGSTFKGKTGGVGLGRLVWELTTELDETGKPYSDPIDPDQGSLISIEKQQVAANKYPKFMLRRGKQPLPVYGLIDKMTPEETDMLLPLEEIVRELTVDEQWKCLASVIDPEIVEKIRASVGR